MGLPALELPMTAAEFLAWEDQQTVRHEFVAGEVFAMAGAGKAHGKVTGNVYLALRQHLRGSPCSTFITETRLHVDAADAYFYPDVMVTCSARDAEDPMLVREPLLLVEVRSPGTEGYDHSDKFAAYRQLPTLREFALVDPRTRRCEVFRKGDDGLWVLHPFAADQGLQMASVALDVPAALLWEDVPAVPPPSRGHSEASS